MRLWVLGLILAITGCGYAPASYYAKSVVGESVSTDVVISMEDPQNTVLIKDAVDRAVITKFRTALKPKNVALTHLKIAVSSVAFTPLRYDTNGYVVTYRTTVSMSIEKTLNGEKSTYTTHGIYDFDIEPNSIISDQSRFEAISQGAQKAIDTFVAQVSAQGATLHKD